MRRRIRWGIALLGVALTLVILGGWSLPWWLIASPSVPAAEVILHYPIETSPLVDEYVAALNHQKVAPKIVCISKPVLCELYSADYARQRLMALGVPAEDVLTLHLPNANCVAENLPRIIAMVKAHGWQQAVMVVRAPFSRIEGKLTAKYFEQAELRVTVTSAPKDRERFGIGWWTDHKTAQNTIQATISALLDPLYPECR